MLVVGGGPAGAQAALSSAERGHRVTLLERGERLGGQLDAARRLAELRSWGDLVDDLERALARHGVEVRLRTEASVASVHAARADAVLIATGARHERSGRGAASLVTDAVPGLDAAHVLDVREAALDPERCGARVVLLDDFAGLASMALALALAQRGRTVTLATRQPMAGFGVLATGDAPWVYPRMLAAGVTVLTQPS